MENPSDSRARAAVRQVTVVAPAGPQSDSRCSNRQGQMDDPDYVLEQETEAVETCSDSASQLLRAWVERHSGLKGVRASCSTTKSFEESHGEARTRYVYTADLVGQRKLTDVRMDGMTITTDQALDPMPFHLENSVVHVWNPFWHKNLLPGEKVRVKGLFN